MLGGEVIGRERHGKGSTFTVTVPEVYTYASARTPAQLARQRGAIGTVLVIDDEREGTRMLAEPLAPGRLPRADRRGRHGRAAAGARGEARRHHARRDHAGVRRLDGPAAAEDRRGAVRHPGHPGDDARRPRDGLRARRRRVPDQADRPQGIAAAAGARPAPGDRARHPGRRRRPVDARHAAPHAGQGGLDGRARRPAGPKGSSSWRRRRPP